MSIYNPIPIDFGPNPVESMLKILKEDTHLPPKEKEIVSRLLSSGVDVLNVPRGLRTYRPTLKGLISFSDRKVQREGMFRFDNIPQHPKEHTEIPVSPFDFLALIKHLKETPSFKQTKYVVSRGIMLDETRVHLAFNNQEQKFSFFEVPHLDEHTEEFTVLFDQIGAH